LLFVLDSLKLTGDEDFLTAIRIYCI